MIYRGIVNPSVDPRAHHAKLVSYEGGSHENESKTHIKGLFGRRLKVTLNAFSRNLSL